MQKKRLSALVLALVMAVSILGACGTPAPTPAPVANTPDSGASSTDAPTPAGYEEIVYTCHISEPDSYNPYGSIGAAKNYTVYQTFENLAYIDLKTGEILPRLATSWVDANGDALAWDITLKEGVTFHNGMEMTAEDVKFTWEYAGSGGTGGVVEAIAANDFVDNIEILDTYKLRFNLKSSMLDFPTYLESMILCKGAYDTLPKEQAEIIGTGPYYIDMSLLKPGVEWGISRYDGYHGGMEGHETKQFIFKVLPDLNTRVAALQTGEIDFTIDLSASFYETLMADPNVTVKVGPGASVYYIGFNYHNAFDVEDDLALRQAIAYGVDKEAIVNISWNNGIGATVHDNFCSPSMLGYDASITDPYAYNPDAARAILEGMGYTQSNPLKLRLAHYSGATTQVAEVFQALMSEIGIEVTLRQIDSTNWSAFKRDGKDYDIFVDYAGYKAGLLTNFSRFFADGGSAGALYGYASPDYMAMQAKVLEATTYEDMLTEYAALQQWIVDTLPMYPIAVGNVISGMRSDVIGFEPSTSAAKTDITFVCAPERS
jgi:ABC-type dipeptide transport system, periplasmic component